MKESKPMEAAEYAVSCAIDHEPAFAWWVPAMLKCRNRIIAAVIKWKCEPEEKFGIKVPNTLAEALQFDCENGDTQWHEAVRKEINTVKVAFRVIDDNEVIPPGYQQIGCHLIYTVKMENFRRKVWYLGGGHATEAPASLTYASVVSRESMRIALTMAALNDLEVKIGDVENAYLMVPVAEKIWTWLGPEFGDDSGMRAIVVRSLYGLKSAGASYQNHMAECMRTIGYTSCMADPDLWYKSMVCLVDGFEYYAYVLIYVDDCIAIGHHDTTEMLHEIDKYFKMKPGSIGDPDIYLGAKLRQCTLPNGVRAWALSPSKYVQEAIKMVKQHLTEKGMLLFKKRVTSSFPSGLMPELNVAKELDHSEAKWYQLQVGVLRWMVKLGHVDIITEESLLASHSALPCEGHLDAMYHLYVHIKKNHNS
jgi:Reverse transcriptase (RNA-dependent DNA polymerase)